MTDLNFAGIETLAQLVRAKDVSPSEVMEHTLSRVEALNPSLNAIVALDADAARAEAAEQTDRIATGDDLGPLGGVPFAVKDLENLAGFRTTGGSPAYGDVPPADRDDVHIERLKAAGAIAIGKTNTPEFGLVPYTDNELFGATRNPWNLERTPGGSSGGSAAAVASGMLAMATGSDGGGSVRIPACYTGLFGFKPSFGRVPIGPAKSDNWMDTTCYGPLTRSVRDGARMLDVMAGPSDVDRNSLPAVGFAYRDRIEEAPPRLRIAFNRTLGVTRVQSDVMREVEAAVNTFREMGHDVEETDDAIPEIGGYWRKISAFNHLSQHWDDYAQHADEFGKVAGGSLPYGFKTDAEDFGKFGRMRQALVWWTAEIFSTYDLLLTPTLPTEAFAAEGPVPHTLDGEKFSPVAFTYPFNFTGHPAASVRAGLTDAGLPCGLQIVGPRHRDDLVLQASAAYEEARPWNDHWPEL